ncbi:MAG: hypothetical protein A2W23_04215 [Planctomycetes bacterium RBG_16_43_13]|nr:MAG: hypothetical protein A2W23_04215 [Planctomycetes bacterium RBG_16_43_13]
MQQGQPQEGEEDVDKALEDLEQARKDLEEQKNELEGLENDELLVKLETELKKIIASQEVINKTTVDMDGIKKTKGGFERSELIKLKQLAKQQDALTETLAIIQKRLDEEEVWAFAHVVASVIGDMKSSAELVGGGQTGDYTQLLQTDIIKRLQDLVDAFKDEREKKKKKGGGGGGGGGGKPPLVPDIVQLRMLRTMQRDILKRTEGFKQTFGKEGEDLDPLEKQILRRLTSEQGKLGDLMKKFTEKFEKSLEEQKNMERERQH